MVKLTGTVLSISENSRVRSEGHQMTKFDQNTLWSYHSILKCLVAILSTENTYITEEVLSISEKFLNIFSDLCLVLPSCMDKC